MAEDMRNVASTEGMSEFERGYVVPNCVVLDSAYCSMGRMVALLACEIAGWTYHDSATLLELVPECSVTPDDVDAFERQFTGSEPDVAAVRETEEYQRISTAYHLAAEKAIAEERMTQEGLDPTGTPFFVGCSNCGAGASTKSPF